MPRKDAEEDDGQGIPYSRGRARPRGARGSSIGCGRMVRSIGSVPRDFGHDGGDVARPVEELGRGRLEVVGHGTGEHGERARGARWPPSRARPRALGRGRVVRRTSAAVGRVAVDFQKSVLPARAKPTMVKSEPARIAVQAHGISPGRAECVEDEELAEEAGERRHPGHGDGGGEEERGEEAVLDGRGTGLRAGRSRGASGRGRRRGTAPRSRRWSGRCNRAPPSSPEA